MSAALGAGSWTPEPTAANGDQDDDHVRSGRCTGQQPRAAALDTDHPRHCRASHHFPPKAVTKVGAKPTDRRDARDSRRRAGVGRHRDRDRRRVVVARTLVGPMRVLRDGALQGCSPPISTASRGGPRRRQAIRSRWRCTPPKGNRSVAHACGRRSCIARLFAGGEETRLRLLVNRYLRPCRGVAVSLSRPAAVGHRPTGPGRIPPDSTAFPARSPGRPAALKQRQPAGAGRC